MRYPGPKKPLALGVALLLLLWATLTACSSATRAASPTLSPLQSQGRSVFDAYCSRCHSAGSDTVIVGPSLAGIATRAATRIEGIDAETYIRDSITNPGAFTVEGFPQGVMPANLAEEIPPQDLDALVAYLLTLQ